MTRQTRPQQSENLIAEQTRLLYAALPLANLAVLVVGPVATYVQWPMVSHTAIIGWISALFVITALREFSRQAYLRSLDKIHNASRWLQVFNLGAALSGGLWGVSCIFLFPADNPAIDATELLAHRFFIVFVVAGMAAGASSTLSYHRSPITIFLILALAPFVLRLLFTEDTLHITMALLIGFALLLLLTNATRSARQTEQNILLRIKAENTDFLEKARNELQHRFDAQTHELKQSEERYRTLVENAVDGFVLHDSNGRILDVNRHSCDVLGYTRDELVGMNVADIETRMIDDPEAGPWKTLQPGESITLEGEHRSKDGACFPVEINLVAWMQNGEKLFLATVRDISARKLAEQELLFAKEQAEAASRAKSEFLSRMSHELRTPLNAILGFGQLFEMDEQDPDKKRNAEEIVAAGTHLLSLVNEVLDLARIESSQLQMELQPTALNPVVGESVSLVKMLAYKNGINLHSPHRQENNLSVQADPMRLKQIMVNLLSNAIKYNRPEGNVEIRIRTTPTQRVRVEVVDTGWGIPSEKQGLLFQPFERLDAEKTGIEGAGIGLLICKQLIEQMGGELGLESTPGKGSTFWFELPQVS